MPSMMKAPHSKGADCKMCGGGMCKMASGGEVKNPNHEAEAAHVMGQASKRRMTHDEYMNQPDSGYSDSDKAAIREGIKKQQMPKKMAEGGDVEAPDADEELSHGLGKELMGALDSKDHKKVMSALEACVLHCMSKGYGDV